LVLPGFITHGHPESMCDPLMNTTAFQLKPAVHLEKVTYGEFLAKSRRFFTHRHKPSLIVGLK
jgi:hypothetical protein